jgi:hypothetical protein
LLASLSNLNGTLATPAIMANVVYDIPLHSLPLSLQPYVGAGLGYGWLRLNNAAGNGLARFVVPQHNLVRAPEAVSFGTAGAFAFQAVAGLFLPLHFLRGSTQRASTNSSAPRKPMSPLRGSPQRRGPGQRGHSFLENAERV